MSAWQKLAAGVVAVCLLAAAWTALMHQPRTVDLTNANAPVASSEVPPPVGAVVLEKVDLDTAKKINAAVPFTTAKITPARPFVISGSPADTARATDCLASALYYEAGAEALDGQKAVAQVILNRVRHPAYPKSVCGVVYQGQERATGCQFSFTCDGSMVRVPSPQSWQRLRGVAQSMLGGAVYAPVGWATHYHTDWVVPVWSAKLDKVRAEATHLFFRWAGFWGTPAAFRGSYAGVEPNIAKLGRLSLVHKSGDPAVDALALAPGQSAIVESPSTVSTQGGNGEFILSVSRDVTPSFLPVLAARTCGEREYCKLFVWTNAAKMPASLPVGESQLATAAFSFLRNRAQNFEKSLWNCAQFPEIDRKQCIKKRVVVEGKTLDLIPAEPEVAEVVTKNEVPAVAATQTPVEAQQTGRRRPGG